MFVGLIGLLGFVELIKSREFNPMVEVGFAGRSWHCWFGNAVHLVNL